MLYLILIVQEESQIYKVGKRESISYESNLLCHLQIPLGNVPKHIEEASPQVALL